MFRALVVVAILALVSAFGPARMAVRQTSSLQMGMGKNVAAAAVALGLALPAFAASGTPAKQGFFNGGDASSPYANTEQREDPLYSAYSPYGNGDAAVYNKRKGTAEELAFWKGVLAESEKRVAKVPGYAAKKTWSEITTELTRYTYSMRESMLRLARSSSDPKAAEAAAKTYFTDLNDMYEWATKKNADVITASYEKSLKDLAAFKALVGGK